MLTSEIIAHAIYILGAAAGAALGIIYWDLYTTTKKDLKALRNRIYAMANRSDYSPETSRVLGEVYADLSDLIRSL